MERSSEIGLMKAVGAKDKQIISLFLTATRPTTTGTNAIEEWNTM